MAKHPRDGELIYHFTRLDNLPSIASEGLISRAELVQRGLAFDDVADPEILEGRAARGLDEMVPFHFFPKNPFDYAAVRRAPGQPFCLITVNRRIPRAEGWQVLTCHPLAGGQLLGWDEGLLAIDWGAMSPEGRDFTDHYTRQTCMAEALAPGSVDVEQFASVYVKTKEAAALAESAFGERCYVNVIPHMFPLSAP